MENMVNLEFWRDKDVFITGHTGFKGGWLSLWLSSLGARVHGYALAPPTEPNFFTVTQLSELLTSHTIGDVRDGNQLKQCMLAAQPEIVFHLAAQPLVRYSYTNPVETYSTNVMGTVNLLEAVRTTPDVRAVVLVTSDKCYENQERDQGYRENEPMGGFDPYSSSKGCVELVCSSYRNSYFPPHRHSEHGVSLASARAGNVIGGGDWADDRLVPDFFRALQTKSALHVRSPNALRPWQHVLEPIAGYMLLAEKQIKDGNAYAEAWNFGPVDQDTRTVGWILNQLSRQCPGVSITEDATQTPHEAQLLKLDSGKARTTLSWLPRWHTEYALEQTANWYKAHAEGKDLRAISLEQIARYVASEPLSTD